MSGTTFEQPAAECPGYLSDSPLGAGESVCSPSWKDLGAVRGDPPTACPSPTVDPTEQLPAKASSTTSSSKNSSASRRPTAAAKGTRHEPGTASGSRAKYCPQAAIDSALGRLIELADAASNGDLKALDQLRQALGTSVAWRLIADLQREIEIKMADEFDPEDTLRREMFVKRSSDLRFYLCSDCNSPMVKIAASRVVACWVFAQFLELRLHESGELLSNLKALEQAERRIESAMRTLANAKKLEFHLRPS